MNERLTGTGVIILAAGKGTRMKSRLPKVLHPVCGLPMIEHVVNAARSVSPTRIAIVVGHGSDEVRAAVGGGDIVFVDQRELLGTADAVRRCEAALAGCDEVFVLNGDSPLIRRAMLTALRDARMGAPMAFGVHAAEDRGGFGRVQRSENGMVQGIVERDDGPGGTVERNAGQYVFDGPWLWQELPKIEVSEKGEYYLTVLPQFAYEGGHPAVAVEIEPEDVIGVDTRVLLADAERIMRGRVLEQLMLGGVTIVDPASTYVDAGVVIGQDTTILPNCHLWGETSIGNDCRIGPGTTVRGSTLGDRCEIISSTIADSTIGDGVHAGPYAHVRGKTTIGNGCYLGNYAEVNRSQLGEGVRMHHFSYVGDAEVGDGTNVAAGIITCNYDGTSKHKTVIGRNVFLGSDTMLVAPITIGDNAATGAGSVVTKDVSPGELVAGVPARPMPGRRSSENPGGN